jgi:hypothetical protein
MQHPLRHRQKNANRTVARFRFVSFTFFLLLCQPLPSFASPFVCPSAISLGKGWTPVVY